MQPILITGISGFIGGHVWASLAPTEDVWGLYGSSGKIPLHPDRQIKVDLSLPETFADIIVDIRPRCILHIAGISSIRTCQEQSLLAWRVNNAAVRELAKAADEVNARFILTSTDMVFDGSKGSYREGDTPAPINTYGETKKTAERSLFANVNNAVVVRLNSVFGQPKFEGSSFSEWILEREAKGEPITVFKDQYRSFIDVATLTSALIELIDHPFKGLLHLGGANRLNRVTFARMLLEYLGRDTSGIVEMKNREMDPKGLNPLDTSFDITLARKVLKTDLLRIDEGIRRAYSHDSLNNEI